MGVSIRQCFLLLPLLCQLSFSAPLTGVIQQAQPGTEATYLQDPAVHSLTTNENSLHYSARTRQLQQMANLKPFPPGTPACPQLSRSLVEKYANPSNVILITTMDKLIVNRFARTWISNVRAAGIKYWLIGAYDPWTSQWLGSNNISQCFNVPDKVVKYRGQDESYQWGSNHWHMTTWNKVHVMREIYSMGFHIIHSDSDATWFNDPMPYFAPFLANLTSPPHLMLSTDSLETLNKAADQGLEVATSPWININTGVYFMKQFPHGMDFFKEWLRWQDKNIGHDQDGLNTVVRGRYHRGDEKLTIPTWQSGNLYMWAALNNTTAVSLLPVSMFGNAYTYVSGKPHLKLNHTLFETHWVWTGGSPECKLHAMRDAMHYYDELSYYNSPDLMLMTFDVDSFEAWPGFNSEPLDNTEAMVQFHLKNTNWQLQQTYWAVMGALALNRTLVWPRFRCYCTRNWYMTQACRINGEKHTQFPYTCSLNDMLRVRRVLAGIKFESGSYRPKIFTREYSFLEHVNTPNEIKTSRAIVMPSATPRQPGQPVDESKVERSTLANGTVQLVVPWPLNTQELATLLRPVSHIRVIHLANATQLLGRGFPDAAVNKAYDEAIQKYKGKWCCRSPNDQGLFNKTAVEEFEILPASRRLQLGTATAGSGAP